MSYLLDALKKAEQERKLGEQSELPLYTEPQVKATLPVWLVVLILVVLGLSVFKIMSGSSDDSVSDEIYEEKSAVSSAFEISDVNPEEKSLTAVSKPVAESIDTMQAVPKELSELDAATLSKIPSLNLESHIYSPAAEYRSVVINGQSYSEGSLLAAGVVLNEITQTGIVIKVGEQFVVLPKGISWVSTKHAN